MYVKIEKTNSTCTQLSIEELFYFQLIPILRLEITILLWRFKWGLSLMSKITSCFSAQLYKPLCGFYTYYIWKAMLLYFHGNDSMLSY